MIVLNIYYLKVLLCVLTVGGTLLQLQTQRTGTRDKVTDSSSSFGSEILEGQIRTSKALVTKTISFHYQVQ